MMPTTITIAEHSAHNDVGEVRMYAGPDHLIHATFTGRFEVVGVDLSPSEARELANALIGFAIAVENEANRLVSPTPLADAWATGIA